MKTRDKIIYASLELFNKLGERSVTTNHIAAHLGISPGNLYYHFRNKEDIIHSIFEEYICYMDESFLPASEDTSAAETLRQYCDQIFDSIWRFRFFHASMPDILLKDENLHQKYLGAHKQLSERAQTSLYRMRKEGVIAIDDDAIYDLVELMRLVAGFWLSSWMANTRNQEISRAAVYQGVLKMIALMSPYATTEGKPTLDALKAKYEELRISHEDHTLDAAQGKAPLNSYRTDQRSLVRRYDELFGKED
ncbi:TetR/AcrR family transcriptional regulator [Vibrio tapetis subsp. quintayensis]|uniref:TetR/AcrR family transcriptional regulator n=1 Tax=Vibrio tapetis TaxID=52443 RepID=UPI0025B2BB97|nr:TetR/AcrR family transcriptional regulator [Vibrio tapetis]MDN3678775.1 TetR/AcrR family transcriptional regulator [Vibrio tapetis subsp. quintayensis]